MLGDRSACTGKVYGVCLSSIFLMFLFLFIATGKVSSNGLPIMSYKGEAIELAKERERAERGEGERERGEI